MRGWLPAGGGLRGQDWAGRHRVLTLLLPGCVVALTVFGFARGALDSLWLLTVGLILPCVLGAVLLRPRRLPSMFVAAGLTIACGGFVAMAGGQTEAHYAELARVHSPLQRALADGTPFTQNSAIPRRLQHHAAASDTPRPPPATAYREGAD